MEFSKGKSMPTGKGADPLRRPRASAASASDGQAVKSGSPEVRGSVQGKGGPAGAVPSRGSTTAKRQYPFPWLAC